MKLNIQPLRPNMLFTDKDGQLTKEAYDFLFAIFFRVGGSLSSLDAATMLGGSWSAPNPIGNVTPSTGAFTSLVASKGLLVGGGVSPNGSGLKHQRVGASVPANSSALVTINWPTPFVDSNYTTVCSVYDSTSSTTSATVVHVESTSKASVTIRVNNTSSNTFNGILHVIAMHD